MEKIKIEIRSKELQRALSVLSTAIPANALVPIYGYVKIEVYTGSSQLFLTASDSKVTIKSFAQASTVEILDQDTSFVVPFDDMSKLLKSLPDGPVSVLYAHEENKDHAGRAISDQYTITVVSQTQEYSFEGEDVRTFPAMQSIPKQTFKMDHAQLKEGIGYLKNFVTDIEGAPQFSGIYFDTNEPNLTLVGFDGKASISYFQSDIKSPQMPPFTIPVKMVKFLSDSLRNSSDLIELSVSEKQVSAEFDKVVIHCTLGEANPFVKYKSENPPKPALTALIDINEWKSILARALITVDSTTKSVTHTFRDGLCFVTSEDVLLNKKSSQDLTLTEVEGKDVSITVAGDKLQKMLSSVDGTARVDVAQTDPRYPTLVLFVSPEVVTGISLKQVLMPLVKL